MVKPSIELRGTVTAPPSKSYTHRAIIIGSLAKGGSIIQNPLISDDTMASVEACRKIGAEIKIFDKNKKIQITGISGKLKTPKEVIDVRNSGTTLRIMTSIGGLCRGKVILTGDESIRRRPMQPLLDALEQLGVRTTSVDGKPPVTVQGPLKGGDCRIRGDISSQFISGLLISAPLATNDTKIEIITELKSKPYIDLTLDVIKKFDGRIEVKNNNFYVNGNQTYKGGIYRIEGDYSSAAFILAAAALTESEVTIKNLLRDSKQGDRRIIEILKNMGVDLKTKENELIIKGDGKLSGIEIDLSQNPDLVPIVSVLGSFAKGKTIIKNVEHLRYKECDRLKAMSNELEKMGARIKEGRDYLWIKGIKSLKGARVHGWNDHRVVMALAIAGLRAEGETNIDTAESISVSFPEFVDCLRQLGADLSYSRG
ncbi:MAG: 3-phosphoshikimate 1-carboxyvinyltransferase [Candidatus Altiarchaeales archaeon]|nr:MAG: 3-phosphoshikimate 1-carboxyvinyltransferase [Candidatus Altiarchaeales archaeon]